MILDREPAECQLYVRPVRAAGSRHFCLATIMSFRSICWGALGALVLATPALAQGAVKGQITLLEKKGDETEDLNHAIIYLEPANGTKIRVAPTNTSIALQARQFAPRVRIVTEGSKIEFPNQDPFTHNVFSKAPQGPFDTESYGKNKTRDNVFKTAGVYPLYCNVHPKMTAFVIAVKTPYFTQASDDGKFAIEKVPAGKYSVHVWHDRGGEQVSDLVVPASGLDALRYELDTRGYKFVQHKNKFGKDYQFNGDIY
jgi:plastocyanin